MKKSSNVFFSPTKTETFFSKKMERLSFLFLFFLFLFLSPLLFFWSFFGYIFTLSNFKSFFFLIFFNFLLFFYFFLSFNFFIFLQNFFLLIFFFFYYFFYYFFSLKFKIFFLFFIFFIQFFFYIFYIFYEKEKNLKKIENFKGKSDFSDVISLILLILTGINCLILFNFWLPITNITFLIHEEKFIIKRCKNRVIRMIVASLGTFEVTNKLNELISPHPLPPPPTATITTTQNNRSSHDNLTKPILVLLHGYGGCNAQWVECLTSLQERSFSISSSPFSLLPHLQTFSFLYSLDLKFIVLSCMVLEEVQL